MKVTICLLVVLFMAAGSSIAEERSSPALKIALERSQAPNTFHLTVRNVGHSSVRIVRPRLHTVDTYHSWGGWSLQVLGPGGQFHPAVFPGAIRPLTSADLVELDSGESVSVVINLGRFTRNNRSMLADIPGDYAVVVRYHLEEDKVVLASGSANGEGFVPVPVLPAMESEAVQLIVAGKRGN